MALLDYTHRKAITFGAAVLLLFVLFPTAFTVLFPASDEISYSAGISSSTCGGFFVDADSDGANCTTRYSIVVGNTGVNRQEIITLEVSGVPAVLPLGWNVLDIVATSVRTPAPQIFEIPLNYGRRIVIEGLAPNRLVEFTLVARGMESVDLLNGITVSVQATGRVINNDPTLTVISRFIKNVFGIFGF